MSEIAQQQSSQTVIAPEHLPFIQQGVAIENTRIVNVIRGVCCAGEMVSPDYVALLNIVTGKTLTAEGWEREFGFINSFDDDEAALLSELLDEYESKVK